MYRYVKITNDATNIPEKEEGVREDTRNGIQRAGKGGKNKGSEVEKSEGGWMDASLAWQPTVVKV